VLIDSHAHLNDHKFDADLDAVIERAKKEGVEIIIVPGSDVASSEKAVDLADHYEEVYACAGIHPHETGKAEEGDLQKISELLKAKKVVAVGEIGLDFHYDFSPREIQRTYFRSQLDLAAEANLPVVIHSRESNKEVLAEIASAVERHPMWRQDVVKHPHNRYPQARGVLHSFSGTVAEAWEAIKLGFLISIPGWVTFNKSPAAELVRSIPVEHLLIETDAPYLAPVPYRGRRNEPAFLPYTAEAIATLQGLSVEDVARATSYNARHLFPLSVGQFSPGGSDVPGIAYKIRNSLYLNITLRCNADCIFCDRKGDAVIMGHNLKINREPTVEEIIAAIGDPSRYDEVVFCGYGEPTIRIDVVKEVARWLKSKGVKVRLNTDGHGNIINHRNIVPELVGLVDAVSISLNSADPQQYGQLMQINPDIYFPAMVEFARECVRLIPEVTMTVVAMDGVDVERARKFVEEELGAQFRDRPYF